VTFASSAAEDKRFDEESMEMSKCFRACLPGYAPPASYPWLRTFRSHIAILLPLQRVLTYCMSIPIWRYRIPHLIQSVP